jgi:peptidoglycan-associated lipoprotein
LCAVALLASNAIVNCEKSMAQAAPREVLLGVSRIAPTGDVDPDGMYDVAARQLRTGDAANGQRQLEQLVARFPDTAAADRARRDLATLYAAPKVTANLAPADQMSRLGATVAAEQPAVIGAWRTSVRPAGGMQKPAQEALRDAAGDLVFFSEGSADLGARARKALAAQAQWLVQHGDRAVVVEGHADEPGTVEELKALAERRADAVRGRLIEEGVAAERVRIVTYGNERRVASCADESCAGQNRCAVTLVGGPPVTEASQRRGVAMPQ